MKLIFTPTRNKQARLLGEIPYIPDYNDGQVKDEITLSRSILDLPSYQYYIDNWTHTDLISLDNGPVIGFLQYKELGDSLQLLSLFIVDEFRGNGYGTIATKWLLDTVGSRSHLTVAELNLDEPAILRIADKVGAKPTTEMENGSLKGYEYESPSMK